MRLARAIHKNFLCRSEPLQNWRARTAGAKFLYAFFLLVCLVTTPLSCSRSTVRFDGALTPAFLGAASGVYEVTSNNGVPLPDGQRFFGLEIRGKMVLPVSVERAPGSRGATTESTPVYAKMRA